MTPFKMTYELEAIVPMEFLVTTLRLPTQETFPMEESRKLKIQANIKLERESILLIEMLQRRQNAWADRHGENKVFKKGYHVLVFSSRARKHPK